MPAPRRAPTRRTRARARGGRRRPPRDSLVARFAAEPFDFAPGEAQIYNNSAYFLLGLVIERVSGVDYEDYVQEALFDRLGMDRSSYCSNSELLPRRARGYHRGLDGLIRAPYMDHTWPYAAGSLCSSAGDLVRWLQALHGGEVLPAASYQEMITPARLEDGKPLRYALGAMPERDYPGDAALLVGSYTGPARGQPWKVTVEPGEGGLALAINGGAPLPLVWEKVSRSARTR